MIFFLQQRTTLSRHHGIGPARAPVCLDCPAQPKRPSLPACQRTPPPPAQHRPSSAAAAAAAAAGQWVASPFSPKRFNRLQLDPKKSSEFLAPTVSVDSDSLKTNPNWRTLGSSLGRKSELGPSVSEDSKRQVRWFFSCSFGGLAALQLLMFARPQNGGPFSYLKLQKYWPRPGQGRNWTFGSKFRLKPNSIFRLPKRENSDWKRGSEIFRFGRCCGSRVASAECVRAASPSWLKTKVGPFFFFHRYNFRGRSREKGKRFEAGLWKETSEAGHRFDSSQRCPTQIRWGTGPRQKSRESVMRVSQKTHQSNDGPRKLLLLASRKVTNVASKGQNIVQNGHP